MSKKSEVNAIDLIVSERIRQIDEKGYDEKNDDQYTDGSLLGCAVTILENFDDGPLNLDDYTTEGDDWFMRRANHIRTKYANDPIRRLTIAAAMLAAEIDRLMRARVNK